MNPLQQLLTDGIDQLNLDIGLREQEKLVSFIEILNKWNKVYNLTSIRKPQDMVTLHLLDSLVVLPFFSQETNIKRVLDVGTGGGLPGIPLAICLPDIEFVLMDARNKKIRFIQTVISQLELKNVKAVHSRVENSVIEENCADQQQYDRIISRAFASLAEMLTLCRHLCHKKGLFLAMKGQIPQEEIAQLPEGFKIEAINELRVNGLDAQRHLIQIRLL